MIRSITIDFLSTVKNESLDFTLDISPISGFQVDVKEVLVMVLSVGVTKIKIQ